MKKLLKLLIAIVMLILLVVVMTGCDSDDNSSSKSKKSKSKNKTTSSVVSNQTDDEDNNTTGSTDSKNSNVSVEYLGITPYGDFAFKVKNSGKKPVYIESVDVIFKDASGNFVKKVSTDVQYFTVDEQSEVINYAWGYGEKFSEYPNYEFEVKYSDSYMKEYYITGNLEVTSNDTGSQIAVAVKNNNDKEIKSMKVLVAFYKDGKIVGCKTGYTDSSVAKGATGYINVSYPYDSNYDSVKYDKIETYLLAASTY